MSDTKLVKKNTISRFLPFSSIVAAVVVIFLFYAFFSGLTFQFYASVLFGFYALTNKMWVSVMFLGVFQTILLSPLRVVRVIKQNNIKEFQQQIGSMSSRRNMVDSIKTNVSLGNKTFLFYLVDFTLQLVTFVTIGRLFLTDFYNLPLDRNLLYTFVPYPEYPIQDTFFKIPYLRVMQTIDLGFEVVLVIWVLLIALQVFILLLRSLYRQSVKGGQTQMNLPKRLTKYASGYLVIAFLASYFLVKNFPVSFDINIFSGDVSIPNRSLNTITAIATFITVLWFGIPKNIRKAKLAEKAGISQEVIDKTQMSMFKESLKNATILGIGAFMITNQIPSAFELSIFTLEIISLASPLTFDRLVLAFQKTKANTT